VKPVRRHRKSVQHVGQQKSAGDYKDWQLWVNVAALLPVFWRCVLYKLYTYTVTAMFTKLALH